MPWRLKLQKRLGSHTPGVKYEGFKVFFATCICRVESFLPWLRLNLFAAFTGHILQCALNFLWEQVLEKCRARKDPAQGN